MNDSIIIQQNYNYIMVWVLRLKRWSFSRRWQIPSFCHAKSGKRKRKSQTIGIEGSPLNNGFGFGSGSSCHESWGYLMGRAAFKVKTVMTKRRLHDDGRFDYYILHRESDIERVSVRKLCWVHSYTKMSKDLFTI